MTMFATVQQAVEAAFAAAGDLIQAVTWRKQTLGAYNPATGEQPATNADTSVRAVEDEITAGDIQRLTLSHRAVKLVIPAVDFVTSDPVYQDKLVLRGTTYTAKECAFRGAKAVWEIFADV